MEAGYFSMAFHGIGALTAGFLLFDVPFVGTARLKGAQLSVQKG